MKKLAAISLIAFFLITSCISRDSEPLPMPEDEMIKLLFDIHVAEGALTPLISGPKKDSLADLYYNQIAEIHQVDRAMIDTCLAILQRNPEKAKEIYEKVSEHAEKKKLGK